MQRRFLLIDDKKYFIAFDKQNLTEMNFVTQHLKMVYSITNKRKVRLLTYLLIISGLLPVA